MLIFTLYAAADAAVSEYTYAILYDDIILLAMLRRSIRSRVRLLICYAADKMPLLLPLRHAIDFFFFRLSIRLPLRAAAISSSAVSFADASISPFRFRHYALMAADTLFRAAFAITLRFMPFLSSMLFQMILRFTIAADTSHHHITVQHQEATTIFAAFRYAGNTFSRYASRHYFIAADAFMLSPCFSLRHYFIRRCHCHNSSLHTC